MDKKLKKLLMLLNGLSELVLKRDMSVRAIKAEEAVKRLRFLLFVTIILLSLSLLINLYLALN